MAYSGTTAPRMISVTVRWRVLMGRLRLGLIPQGAPVTLLIQFG